MRLNSPARVVARLCCQKRSHGTSACGIGDGGLGPQANDWIKPGLIWLKAFHWRLLAGGVAT